MTPIVVALAPAPTGVPMVATPARAWRPMIRFTLPFRVWVTADPGWPGVGLRRAQISTAPPERRHPAADEGQRLVGAGVGRIRLPGHAR